MPLIDAPPDAPARVGAVVVGGDYQGLGIVRSLGRRGIPVCVIDDERSIARHSRYTTHTLVVKSFGGARSTVDTLLAAGSRLQLDGWVLYPTREETVAAISQHRQELAQRFRVPTPEWEVIRWAWDKRNTYALAHQLGIPTPRTWYPKTVDDLLAIDGSPPFAVKPAIKEHFFYATRAKAWKASTRAELAGLFQRAAGIVGPGEVMVQEFIPGGGDQQLAYCAFFKSGVAVGEMVARRLRQHPLEFGRASTLVETANLPLLESLSERLLRAIDYYGLVEIEYKLDPRDGQYKLLDINARTWGYHSLGGAAGVDFPYLLFLDQIGHHAEPCRARAGVRWVRTLTDLPTAIVAVLKRRLSWSAYVRSLRGLATDAVFCRDDPVPGLLEVALLPYLALKRGF
jgi:predicted ATP-grasp superfamily ATP-dependent carboligase